MPGCVLDGLPPRWCCPQATFLMRTERHEFDANVRFEFRSTGRPVLDVSAHTLVDEFSIRLSNCITQ